MTLRAHIIRAGFDALYYTGAHHLLRPLFAGRGAILMLHHVRPPRDDAFQPNRHLEVSPAFLRVALAHLRNSGLDFVSLDEALRRLQDPQDPRRFVCFTFDDGYRDNRDHALPVMRDFDAPFTVFVTAGFADGGGDFWWLRLERLLAAVDSIEVPVGRGLRLDTTTAEGKLAGFARLHGWLRGLSSDAEMSAALSDLATRHGVATEGTGRDLCMRWSELRAFAADPLVQIGAHTLTHCALGRASAETAREEIAGSRDRIASELQIEARHFAYPYGDRAAAGPREFDLVRELGFASAVTTRPGMLFADNAAHLAALPRISLNGNFQDTRFLSVLASGAATAVWNGFRRVDAA
jgi:peptidoglycan/xylan/chitin deacetylase (PgdA/CDA1 family)